MASGIYTVKESESPEPIPVGIYSAKFADWEEKDDGQYGPYVRLEFEITSGEQKGTKRSLVASTKLKKGKDQKTTSKLFKIVSSLLGKEPSTEEKVSLKELVGTKCQIMIEDREGDEEGWQDITKVLPAKD